jgi:predicted DCC family thiol-disulfide oxidoreductase YuxK
VKVSPLVLLYDADCAFCTRGIEFIRSLDRDGALTAAPISSPIGSRLLRDLTEEQRRASWHVVDERGRRWSGGRGVAPVLRRLPGLRLLAPVAEAFPAPVELGYRLVARNRRTLGRLTGTPA